MSKDRSLYIRIDILTELLIGHLSDVQSLNKSEIVRKSIYDYAINNMSQDEFNSLVQLAVDCERL